VWAAQHLGAEGENATADELKRKVTQAAYNAAAVQTAISVGLQFVPVVGQALSAVYSVINMFTGRAVKARMKQEMEGVKERLTAHGETRKAEVLEVRDRVALEERMRVQAGQKGLSGGLFKTVARAIERAAVDTKEQVKDTAKSVERSDASEVARKPSKLKDEITSVWGTVTGRESLAVMREKINVVEEDAKAKIDAQANEAKEMIESPQGRAALREEIRSEAAGEDSPFLSAAPWVLGSLAVVAVAGIILLRKRR
jgi:hypothetical protein